MLDLAGAQSSKGFGNPELHVVDGVCKNDTLRVLQHKMASEQWLQIPLQKKSSIIIISFIRIPNDPTGTWDMISRSLNTC